MFSRKEYQTGQPSEILTMTPAIVKFIPAIPTTCPILKEDLTRWESSPHQLVGKCFISKETVRRVFLIDDYSVKQRKGPQYDVLYEDLGLDEVLTLDPKALFTMLSNDQAELVTNAFPRAQAQGLR